MEYHIRKADGGDLGRILEIYACARAFMAQTGNPTQWGKTHPSEKTLREDIAQGNLYLVCSENGIHGVFALCFGEDPTYKVIENGAWSSDAPYGTIHRIASDGSGGVFSAAVAYCRERVNYLRIDTHHDNRVMQHILEKNGFTPCGVIYVEDGSPRIAYDRI